MNRLLVSTIGVFAPIFACLSQPVTSKSFTPSTVAPGATASLVISVTAPPGGLTDVSFTDTLTGGLKADPVSAVLSCSGGSSAILSATATSVGIANGVLTAGGTCSLTVSVIAPAADGLINNTTGPVASSAGDGVAGTASLNVISAATLVKQFAVVSLQPATATELIFTVGNPNTNTTLTNVAFSDSLPAGIVINDPTNIVGNCGGGTISAPAGGSTITLTGATLIPQAACNFSVLVKATDAASGLIINISGPASSDQAPASQPALGAVFVGTPMHVSYFPNLNLADAVINVTNTGEYDAPLPTICVNTYVFSPDEQMVACCSCPVTDSALSNISLRTAISNAITPAVPTSVIVKLVATHPIAGSCNNSATTPALVTLSNGLRAWGTKLHTLGSTQQVTELPFEIVNTGRAELARLSGLCSFIVSNGSGFGICPSCRMGGQGGVSTK